MSYLDSLSESQRKAASNIEGASLIIAGAGSGKTRTLTYRIAHMIESGISPYNILALTFTNKAAKEMKERISAVLPPSSLNGLWIGTFHSIFRRILQNEAESLGFPRNFIIYDTSDSQNLLKSIIKEMQLNEEKYKARDVLGRISMAKNTLITPAAYAQNATLIDEDSATRRPELFRIYDLYAKRCKANGAMDFDDLLLQMNYLLRDSPEVAQRYGEMFKYIMVDEYQDTNYSQYIIVKKLAAVHRNICVVGDDSQSIYSFRGARIENILRFEKDFPETQVFRLEENYRSTKVIVEASNSLIDHNKGKLQKKLFSSGSTGDIIRVVESYSDKDEAARVVQDISSTMRSEVALASDFAILYRTHFQSRAFEEQLRGRGIKYRIYENQSFYSRLEIKTMLCYLRLAVNPADDEALKRVINFPARGIGDTSMAKVVALAQQRGESLFETLKGTSAQEIGLRGTAVTGISNFLESFATLHQLATELNAYDFAKEVSMRSGLMQFYKASNSQEDKSRVQNLDELLNSIRTFVDDRQSVEDSSATEFTIADWLGEVALYTSADEDKDDNSPKVSLMTVHASKGLEFKYVYVVGLEERLFPSLRVDVSDSEVEEERRLFYVALTRAMKRVTLSYALSRYMYGEARDCQQSRFIKEIDKRYLDISQCDEGLAPYGGYEQKRSYEPRFGSKAPRFGSGGGFKQRTPSSTTNTVPPQRPSRSKDWLDVGGAMKQLRKVQQGTVEEGVAVTSTGELSIGDTVAHQRFGRGEIVAMQETSSDVKLTIDFAGIGQKVLLKKFAKLTKL